MGKSVRHLAIGFGGMLAAALPSIGQAQVTGLEDLVGARAGQAENGLQARGYRWVRTQKGDDRSYTYWWNADRRQCVTIATMDGRYASITPTPAPDCGQPAGGAPRDDYDQAGRPSAGYEAASRRVGGGAGTTGSGQAVDLGLICFGDGQRDGVQTGSSWTWNRDRDRYEHGTYSQSTREQFDATLTVQLWGGGGRVRLPKSLVPPLHSGGKDGWWELYDTSVGPDVIRASAFLQALRQRSSLAPKESTTPGQARGDEPG